VTPTDLDLDLDLDLAVENMNQTEVIYWATVIYDDEEDWMSSADPDTQRHSQPPPTHINHTH